MRGLLHGYLPSEWGGLLGTPVDYVPPEGPIAPMFVPAAAANAGQPTSGEQWSAEAADHGLSERQKLSPLQKALSPITSYPGTYSRMNQDARNQVSHGIHQITHPDSLTDPQAHGISDVLTGAGNVALGGLGYVWSPVGAAYRSLIGQPVEDTTGISREYTEFAAQLATPGIGLPRISGKPATFPPQPAPNGLLGASTSDLPPNGASASKWPLMYDPPAKPPRPFEADYPKGVSGEPGSPLMVDNAGTALTARNIVGRRTVGGGDEALTPERLESSATSALGTPPARVAGREIRGDAGRFRASSDAEGNPDYKIFVDRGLSPANQDKVIAHEFAHAIDYFSRYIPTDGLSKELRPLYNTLNTGQERTRKLTGPQHLGYSGEDIGREYMAEAIRAYMADPNYIKTVAPGTAARIREYVNKNPRLNEIIQFNSMAGALPAAGAAALGTVPPQDEQP